MLPVGTRILVVGDAPFTGATGKVIGIRDGQKYPYNCRLMGQEVSQYQFLESELVPIPQKATNEQLSTLRHLLCPKSL